ncbi:hypothetical protein BC940DRAFT_114010 [Gongronella butleri]|nr:hypothetical protein BC940DRAFT_114010 [Gongronella butleri]
MLQVLVFSSLCKFIPPIDSHFIVIFPSCPILYVLFAFIFPFERAADRSTNKANKNRASPYQVFIVRASENKEIAGFGFFFLSLPSFSLFCFVVHVKSTCFQPCQPPHRQQHSVTRGTQF